MPFDWFPSFEIFLKNGRLNALFKTGETLLNIIVVYIVLIAAVYVPVMRSSRSPLPAMLTGSIKE
ncbi:hypothetical protein AGMMS50212_16250 [Spirochaetia bacterium]|nr:hypothetical protein AGMMS50212_16250 [Spirochaetia bacterium]